jgi:hypothetical protein
VTPRALAQRTTLIRASEKGSERKKLSQIYYRQRLLLPRQRELVDDNAGFDFRNYPSTPKAKEYKIDLAYLKELQEKPVQDMLECEEEVALEMIQELQESLDSIMAPIPEAREYFSENVQGSVELRHFVRAHMPGSLTPGWVQDLGRQWNLFFRNIACALRNREEEFGAELVPELYVQKKLQREPLEIFRNASTGVGFRATILLDLSGSMKTALPQVQLILKILHLAFDFPQAQINVLGFNSTAPGVTTIYEYPDAESISPIITNQGLTPLPQAIRYAGNTLSGHQDHSHLLVLSDGYPRFFTADNRAVHLKALMSWTREAAQDLLLKKVNLHCIMLGDEVADTDLEWMFGTHWTRARVPHRVTKDNILTQQDLIATIFGFLKAQFVRYLKVR